MRTIKEIAAILGVKPIVAYGLISFMREKELVVPSKAAKTGQRGKTAMTFSFDHTSIEKLSKLLAQLVEQDRTTFNTKAAALKPINPAPEVLVS